MSQIPGLEHSHLNGKRSRKNFPARSGAQERVKKKMRTKKESDSALGQILGSGTLSKSFFR
jgi:hypothetical protein